MSTAGYERLASRFSPASWLRRFIVAVSAVVIAAGIVMLWGAYRYQTVVNLANRTRTQWASLNERYPFVTPRAAGDDMAPERARREAAARVRRRALDACTPALRRRVEAWLQTESVAAARSASALLVAAPDVQRVVDALFEALEAEKMSPEEYRWWTGRLVREALRAPAGDPWGDTYRRLLERAGNLARAEGRRADVAAELLARLDAQSEGVAESATAERPAASPDPVGCALDLIVVASQWIASESVERAAAPRVPAR